MSTLEDIGFRSFTSHDSVGAVATSSSDLWIGGALALGAVLGAVYAWPKRLYDTAPTPAGIVYAGLESHEIRVPSARMARAGLRGEFPVDSPEDFKDIEYRARGFEPMFESHSQLHGDSVSYVPIEFDSVVLPQSVAARLMAGDMPTVEEVRAEVVKLAEKNMASPHNPASLRGLRSAWNDCVQDTVRAFKGRIKDLLDRGFEPVQSMRHGADPDFLRVTFAPGRCMIHRECRKNPELGRACLMAQWDERWKEGSK